MNQPTRRDFVQRAALLTGSIAATGVSSGGNASIKKKKEEKKKKAAKKKAEAAKEPLPDDPSKSTSGSPFRASTVPAPDAKVLVCVIPETDQLGTQIDVTDP